MRGTLALVILLLLAPAGAMAQVVSGTGTYCITGTSTGADYSWWLDLGADALGLATEPHILSGNAVLSSSSASALAAALADQINSCTNTLAHICDVGVSNMCLTGPNITLACTSHIDCNQFPASCSSNVCVGGPLNGSLCSTLDDCSCVMASATGTCVSITTGLTYQLWIESPPANPPTCLVGSSGCAYNPTIHLSLPAPLPGWALLALPLLLLGASTFALRTRSRR